MFELTVVTNHDQQCCEVCNPEPQHYKRAGLANADADASALLVPRLVTFITITAPTVQYTCIPWLAHCDQIPRDFLA